MLNRRIRREESPDCAMEEGAEGSAGACVEAVGAENAACAPYPSIEVLVVEPVESKQQSR